MIIREQIENAYSILIQSTENATRKARLKEELNWIKNQSDEVVNGYKFALNSVNEYDTITPKKIVLARDPVGVKPLFYSLEKETIQKMIIRLWVGCIKNKEERK